MFHSRRDIALNNYIDHWRQAAKKNCQENTQDEAGRGTMSELKVFKKTKIRGVKLKFINSNLKNIQVTSVESERSFSVAGRYCNKLRSCLGDESLNQLTMFHYYYKSNHQ